MSAAFWSRVDVRSAGECWPWLGGRTAKGYGRHCGERAHRIAFALATGQEPGRSFVCHTCDNPPCCNPGHLWLGDAMLNNLDRDAKGRTRAIGQEGEANHNSVLKEGDVREIRRRLIRCASNKALSAAFGVTHSQISNIRRGVSWCSLRELNPCFSLERAAS